MPPAATGHDDLAAVVELDARRRRLDLDTEDFRRKRQREPFLDQRERSPQWIG